MATIPQTLKTGYHWSRIFVLEKSDLLYLTFWTLIAILYNHSCHLLTFSIAISQSIRKAFFDFYLAEALNSLLSLLYYPFYYHLCFLKKPRLLYPLVRAPHFRSYGKNCDNIGSAESYSLHQDWGVHIFCNCSELQPCYLFQS